MILSFRFIEFLESGKFCETNDLRAVLEQHYCASASFQAALLPIVIAPWTMREVSQKEFLLEALCRNVAMFFSVHREYSDGVFWLHVNGECLHSLLSCL